MGHEGAAAIAMVLQRSTHLAELRLAGVGGQGMYTIARQGLAQISPNTALHSIDLSGNRMSERSVSPLASELLLLALRLERLQSVH